MTAHQPWFSSTNTQGARARGHFFVGLQCIPVNANQKWLPQFFWPLNFERQLYCFSSKVFGPISYSTCTLSNPLTSHDLVTAMLISWAGGMVSRYFNPSKICFKTSERSYEVGNMRHESEDQPTRQTPQEGKAQSTEW